MLEPTILGPEIQKRRKKRELTQEQLGARLGVTAAAVSKWETGETLPDTALLPGICQVLGISPNELLGIGPNRSGRMSHFYQFGSPPKAGIGISWPIFLVFGCALLLGRAFKDANPLLVIVPILAIAAITIAGIIKGADE